MTFVDTSALYVVLDRDDEGHAAVRDRWETLLRADEALLVTNYVVVETMALVQHRLGMEALRTFCTDILPVFDVHRITEADHASAVNALISANRRRLSLVDCSSFQVMRIRGVHTALTLDPHFREQGFEIAP